MADLADRLFSHCLAVIQDRHAAEEVAALALRRAGRSRGSLFAHARSLAVERAGERSPDVRDEVPDDLARLAALLATTRPPAERAVVDLRARLDRGELARALGLPAAIAAERATAVGEAWDRELDAAVLAWMGPGECDELAALLAETPRSTVGELLDVAPAVRAHADACAVCSDRLRAMVSTRAVLAQLPDAPAPASVIDAARRSRRRRPAQAPPPFEPAPPSSRRRVPVAVVVAAVVLIAGGAATAVAFAVDGGDSDAVDRLTRLPVTGSALIVEPASFGTDVSQVTLVNRSGRSIRWRASASAEWLDLSPLGGILDAGASVPIAVRVLPASPEGDVRASLTVAGNDGSVASGVLQGRIERPPDVGVSLDGCTVTASVEDQSSVADVVLHWRDGGEHAVPMGSSPKGYVGVLPAGRPATWWVSAADGRGNRATTAEQPLAC